MSPRMRSNRAEKTEYQRMAALGTPANAVGLPSLPDELLLLIVSFFPTCRIPEETRDLPENGFAPRHKTLLILTMTCRALRRVCLPFLWQRIEARFGMEGVDSLVATHGVQHWTEKGKKDAFLYGEGLAREIRRQLQMVTVREPKYATYVNTINLDAKVSVDTLLPQLLDSLELFPRLHTIRLRMIATHYSKEHQRVLAVLSSWKPKTPLASIKRWYSNQLLAQLISFCPNLHTAGGLPSDFIDLHRLSLTLAQLMPSVERFQNVARLLSEHMPDVAFRFPNLRHIGSASYAYASESAELQSLAVFRYLDSIEIQVDSRSWAAGGSEWRDELSAGPMEALRSIQRRDKRVKRFGMRGSFVGLKRRVFDLELPLCGITWTEGEVEVQP